jgi:hypothetical protein
MEMILEDYISISHNFTSKWIISYNTFDVFYFSINKQARFAVIKSQACFLSPEAGEMIVEGKNSLNVTVKIDSSNIYQYKNSLFVFFILNRLKLTQRIFEFMEAFSSHLER